MHLTTENTFSQERISLASDLPMMLSSTIMTNTKFPKVFDYWKGDMTI